MVETKKKKHIIAIGGGGFADNPHNLLLERYLVKQAHQVNPKICFISTASGDSQSYIDKFYSCFTSLRCVVNHLPLFRRNEKIPSEVLQEQDILYVGGGNTANMLAIWSLHDICESLMAAYDRGTILAGNSAGAICWFQGGITDSFGKPYRFLDGGFNFLPGLFCPHYSSETERRFALRDAVKATGIKGYGVDDDVALHFINGLAPLVVRSKPVGSAYLLEGTEQGICEHVMPSEGYLDLRPTEE